MLSLVSLTAAAFHLCWFGVTCWAVISGQGENLVGGVIYCGGVGFLFLWLTWWLYPFRRRWK